MNTPIHDEQSDADAIVSAKVLVPSAFLVASKASESEWTTLDSEDIVVRLELTPNAWRGLASALARFPYAPEWRLDNALNASDQGVTAWEECRPGEPGPGAMVGADSCMICIRVVRSAK